MLAKKGDWVQIELTILTPEQRAPQVPEDTKKVPLKARLKGFLVDEVASLGGIVTVRTPSGRLVTGTLVSVNPKYEHDFGEPVPELITIGLELRQILEESVEEKNLGGEV